MLSVLVSFLFVYVFFFFFFFFFSFLLGHVLGKSCPAGFSFVLFFLIYYAVFVFYVLFLVLVSGAGCGVPDHCLFILFSRENHILQTCLCLCVHFIYRRITWWPSVGIILCRLKCISSFPFDVLSRMRYLIASVPDHCLFIYFCCCSLLLLVLAVRIYTSVRLLR